MASNTAKILLVEDDFEDALLLQGLLEGVVDCSFDVEHVSTSAAAVERLEQRRFDAMLLDLALPDSQGFDTVVRFRTQFPSLPMVIVSGSDDEMIGIQAVECGAQDYVAKGLVAGQLLARAIRFAIARHSQITSFKAQAHTDSLTGLPNRRAFDTEIAQRIGQQALDEPPLSLMILDIDHFKRLNDTYGHRAGDYVLCQLGGILSNSVRQSDSAARYGGEEFGIILPATDSSRAKPVGFRLLRAIEATTFEFEGHSINITASVGIAQAARHDVPATLLQRADAALYAAKNGGRNCGFVHDGRRCRRMEPGSVELAVGRT
jgi:diguanylate cyclase (GGDEF)-like protein